MGLEISIDSYQPETQLWAMQQGVDWLNDIQGFADAGVQEALADSSCRLFVMHSIQSAGPARRQGVPEGDILDIVAGFFEQRLTEFDRRGIARDRLVLDPGMGFFLGDGPEPSVRVLSHIDRLKQAFDLPVLVSVSRKSFLRTLSGRSVEDSGPVTLAAELWAARQGLTISAPMTADNCMMLWRCRRILRPAFKPFSDETF